MPMGIFALPQISVLFSPYLSGAAYGIAFPPPLIRTMELSLNRTTSFLSDPHGVVEERRAPRAGHLCVTHRLLT